MNVENVPFSIQTGTVSLGSQTLKQNFVWLCCCCCCCCCCCDFTECLLHLLSIENAYSSSSQFLVTSASFVARYSTSSTVISTVPFRVIYKLSFCCQICRPMAVYRHLCRCLTSSTTGQQWSRRWRCLLSQVMLSCTQEINK